MLPSAQLCATDFLAYPWRLSFIHSRHAIVIVLNCFVIMLLNFLIFLFFVIFYIHI